MNDKVIENFKGPSMRDIVATSAPPAKSDQDNTWIYVAGIGGGVLVIALIAYFMMSSTGNGNVKKSSGGKKKNARVGFKF